MADRLTQLQDAVNQVTIVLPNVTVNMVYV